MPKFFDSTAPAGGKFNPAGFVSEVFGNNISVDDADKLYGILKALVAPLDVVHTELWGLHVMYRVAQPSGPSSQVVVPLDKALPYVAGLRCEIELEAGENSILLAPIARNLDEQGCFRALMAFLPYVWPSQSSAAYAAKILEAPGVFEAVEEALLAAAIRATSGVIRNN